MPVKLGHITTCCTGSMYAGPDWGVLLLTFFIIAGPGTAVVVVVPPHLAVNIIGAIILAASLGFLCATAFSDPGIIPRQPAPPALEGDEPGLRDEPVEVRTRGPDGRETTHTVMRRWCYTCNVLRPARASHCPYCDCCVERHDHHCPWTGTCIGGRNYRFFYGFVSSTTLFTVYTIATSIASLVVNQRAHSDDANTNGVEQMWAGAADTYYLSVALGIYALLGLCCVGSLCFYHTDLVIHNETTHERIKGRYSRAPYDSGCSSNAAAVLCGPRGTSRVPPYLRGEPNGDDVIVANLRRQRAPAAATTTVAAATDDSPPQVANGTGVPKDRRSSPPLLSIVHDVTAGASLPPSLGVAGAAGAAATGGSNGPGGAVAVPDDLDQSAELHHHHSDSVPIVAPRTTAAAPAASQPSAGGRGGKTDGGAGDHHHHHHSAVDTAMQCLQTLENPCHAQQPASMSSPSIGPPASEGLDANVDLTIDEVTTWSPAAHPANPSQPSSR